VYNIHSLPPGANTCSRDGAQLYQRPDDKEEVVGKRLEVYQTQTQPLIEHYSQLGLLRVVAGEGELGEVFERMEAAALAKPVPASKVQVSTARKKSVARKAVKQKQSAPRRKASRKKATARRPARKSAKRVAKRKVVRSRRATKSRRK
jgi:adenylate kinase